MIQLRIPWGPNLCISERWLETSGPSNLTPKSAEPEGEQHFAALSLLAPPEKVVEANMPASVLNVLWVFSWAQEAIKTKYSQTAGKQYSFHHSMIFCDFRENMLNFYRQAIWYYRFSGDVTAMGFPQQTQVMFKLLFSTSTLLKINLSCKRAGLITAQHN